MARKRKKVSADDGGGADDAFAMMFVSLNLILLSFFILLNSIAVRDSKKSRKALGSLLGTFGILEGGHSTTKGGVSILPSDPMGDQKSQALKRHSDRSELEILLDRLKTKLGKDKLSVIATADNLQVEFPNEVLFRAGGVELNPEIFPVLDEVARLMKLSGRQVAIQGFSDPRRPVNYPSNLELSGTRAVRVARYLIEAASLDARLVRAEGMGAAVADRTHSRYVKIVLPSSALSKRLEK